jgi:hypothetical protein
MNSIEEALKNKKPGLYYNNRLILPFKAYFLKVIVGHEIITDFSHASKGILINEEIDFTDVYFHDYENLKKSVSKYEAIKMVLVEKDKDIFNLENHVKLAVYLQEKHKAVIEMTDDDILFIE